MKELVLGVVSHNFRPEFINRIDEVVVFHPLGEQHIASIAQIQLKRLYKRLEERGYEIHISDEALKLLSENGYDPVYGARPLKRAIQQQIENPLAQQIRRGAETAERERLRSSLWCTSFETCYPAADRKPAGTANTVW